MTSPRQVPTGTHSGAALRSQTRGRDFSKVEVQHGPHSQEGVPESSKLTAPTAAPFPIEIVRPMPSTLLSFR